jgi:ferredoxin
VWEYVGDQCFECGACTFVCPSVRASTWWTWLIPPARAATTDCAPGTPAPMRATRGWPEATIHESPLRTGATSDSSASSPIHR